jgi:uncharacterized membrane protein YjjP (DUF1212 family)
MAPEPGDAVSQPANPSQADEVGEPDPVKVAFILTLVRALHSYGESAQRLEDILEAMSTRLGLHGAQCFSTPTSIMASFGPLGRQRTYMLRVQPGEVNLGRLSAVERVAVDVAHGRLTIDEGTAAITRMADAPSPYGPVLTMLAFGAASGAACQFLGGGGREIAAASVLGLGVGLFGKLAGAQPRVSRVFEPLASFLVSAAAVAFAHLTGAFALITATLGGLIVLLPGLTLTTALSELATRHLASGTARLSGAFITFLSIVFGVAFGNRVGTALLGAVPLVDVVRLPGWATVLALLVAPLCFTVILRAELKDAPWIVAAGALGVVGGRFGADTLGVELGAFIGAFAVALASVAFERIRHRPAAVVLVPGILMLVPGSVGFRSLIALLERQALAGVETAFSTVLTAVALVAGLLIAGVLAPERRLRDMLAVKSASTRAAR